MRVSTFRHLEMTADGRLSQAICLMGLSSPIQQAQHGTTALDSGQFNNNSILEAAQLCGSCTIRPPNTSENSLSKDPSPIFEAQLRREVLSLFRRRMLMNEFTPYRSPTCSLEDDETTAAAD